MKIKCPACNQKVTPIPFILWPGMTINVCPICRIGLGFLSAPKIKEAKKKVRELKRPRKKKIVDF